ncbi:hypothetical protein HQ590_02285 [bacterium]|nr:hypothetical protein [bacterium]
MTTPTTPSAEEQRAAACCERAAATATSTWKMNFEGCGFAEIIAENTRCKGKTAQEWAQVCAVLRSKDNHWRESNDKALRRAEQAEAKLEQMTRERDAYALSTRVRVNEDWSQARRTLQ